MVYPRVYNIQNLMSVEQITVKLHEENFPQLNLEVFGPCSVKQNAL